MGKDLFQRVECMAMVNDVWGLGDMFCCVHNELWIKQDQVSQRLTLAACFPWVDMLTFLGRQRLRCRYTDAQMIWLLCFKYWVVYRWHDGL